MLDIGPILFISLCYMGLLFGIAYVGDRQADMGKSIISNPYVYALSLAVYCTAWTFYGSVGRAVQGGPAFLTIYIGPTLMMSLGWLVLRKIIRIGKVHRITSIADFIASRYGKSAVLGGTVTIIAVWGIIPYISLQLKAISVSFLLISQYPNITMPHHFAEVPLFHDTAFYIALMLTIFAILFGTRHIEATEQHEGLVAAIAFESIVKLIAFLAVGGFVTYWLYTDFPDLPTKARSLSGVDQLFQISNKPGVYTEWGFHIFLSMMAVVFLPRQFQLMVVENVNEDHLNKAIWLFPLYLLAINIFVLPVALGGMIYFPDKTVDADTYVLTLPMLKKQDILTVAVYLGGMSAATGMVIVETIALSIMICNELVVPILVRLPMFQHTHISFLSRLLLMIRRCSIFLVIMLGYMYFRYIGEFYPLVSIGLVSFAAVAQFAPSILIGIFWKGATRAGAFAGLICGFFIWVYTLFFPSLVHVGILPQEFVINGPFGIELLKPFQLFGLKGFSHVSHAVFWSLLFNMTAYVGVSLFTRPSAIEHTQATWFVDVFKYAVDSKSSSIWRGTAMVRDISELLERFLGKPRTEEALMQYAKKHNINWEKLQFADAGLVNYAETLLAGVIGSASARVMVSSVVKEEPLGIEEVMNILDETRQVIAYSQELEKATAELRSANERLKELDKLKDEFISTVTHELRTPLTSIRALAEILHDNPDIQSDQQIKFSGIIIKETDRLTRLISQVLDLQKIESGKVEWQVTPVDLKEVVIDSITSTQQLIQDNHIQLQVFLPEKVPLIMGDRDRLIQVMVNLISNAVKFCNPVNGMIEIRMVVEENYLKVDVKDNGIGIRPEDIKVIFEKFRQIRGVKGRPSGTGLGLSITKHIVEYHGGSIWAESEPDKGTVFSFTIPKSTTFSSAGFL